MRVVLQSFRRLLRLRLLMVLVFLTCCSLIVMWKRLTVIPRTFSQSNEVSLAFAPNHDKRDKFAWMRHSRVESRSTLRTRTKFHPTADDNLIEEENVIPKLMAISDSDGESSQLTVPLDYLSAKYLRQFVKSVNREQTIYNMRLFPNRPANGPVVVVQVHKRVEHFSNLLKSMRAAPDVKDILLIISHDYISDALNAAVKTINFCQFMQIYFPYSVQLHPLEYPGSDPNDCPRDATKAKALAMHCNNAEHPDTYGHYREAKFAMTKLHWWWKANMVFDNLKVTQNYKGPVVMLEEDHHVAPDFFDVLKKLDRIKQSESVCEGTCDILSLGTYTKIVGYALGADQVSLTSWRSYEHNMAMTLYRKTWETIKKCGKEFCSYDDYNWDWSLMKMSLNCLTRPLTVLAITLPRVFHLGGCGMHHKEDCNVDGPASRLQSLFDNNKEFLFQKSLNAIHVNSGEAHVIPANGGWGDTRDHELCNRFMYGKLTEVD